MTAALEGGEWSVAHPGRTLPPRKTQYPYSQCLCKGKKSGQLPVSEALSIMFCEHSLSIQDACAGIFLVNGMKDCKELT